MKTKQYELWVHYKQGDDLSQHLEHNEGDGVKSLAEWSEYLAAGAKQVRQVAEGLKGAKFDLQADVHWILFTPEDEASNAIFQGLVSQGLLSASRLHGEDEEEEEEDLDVSENDVGDDE